MHDLVKHTDALQQVIICLPDSCPFCLKVRPSLFDDFGPFPVAGAGCQDLLARGIDLAANFDETAADLLFCERFAALGFFASKFLDFCCQLTRGNDGPAAGSWCLVCGACLIHAQAAVKVKARDLHLVRDPSLEH